MYVIAVHLAAEPGERLVLAIVLSLPFIEGNFGHLSLCLLTGARTRWLLPTALSSGQSDLHEPHHHRASKVCRVLIHKSGVVQAHRTYTKHTSTEIARCVGYCFSSSGWFKHIEPQRTYTNHTITELARCVGCLCTSSGGSSTSNLHEPHHHKYSKVCRVVQAQRTYTNHTITVIKVCRALVRGC